MCSQTHSSAIVTCQFVVGPKFLLRIPGYVISFINRIDLDGMYIGNSFAL